MTANLLDFQNFYLVGIKGVAMASMAQLLIDAEKNVAGSDVEQDFVTKIQLDKLPVKIDFSFDIELPKETDCVIYTAAHDGKFNSQVRAAVKAGIAVFSHAEALGILFNQKRGIAVCGVGGKSTVSAMIAWILDKAKLNPSFSVGVGDIPGLDRTGVWKNDSKDALNNSLYFVAEADEYVIDPSAPERGEKIVPRFSFLKPFITVCTNLKYDHPDVYKDFTHTKEVYGKFFEQVEDGGFLVVNADSEGLVKLAKRSFEKSGGSEHKIITFGEKDGADFKLISYESFEGVTKGVFEHRDMRHELSLQIPGKFNLLNALSATAAVAQIYPELISKNLLSDFKSTARRFEFVEEISGVKYYDDYAHHPHEVKAAIKAISEWYPDSKVLVAFQSHTYSRTKKLFSEFVDAFAEAKEVVMIDIFPSAREKADVTVTSTKLCEKIVEKYPNVRAENLGSIENLGKYFKENLKEGDVCLTLGAGDIYEVYELLK